MSNHLSARLRRPQAELGPPTLSQRGFRVVQSLLDRANRLVESPRSDVISFWPDEDRRHWPSHLQELYDERLGQARSLRTQALRAVKLDMSQRIPWTTDALSRVHYDPKAMRILGRTGRAVTLGWKDEQKYQIKRGDTLSEIAEEVDLPIDYLMHINPQIRDRNLIYAGRSLNLNPIRTYLNDSAFRSAHNLNRTLVHDAFWHGGVQRLTPGWKMFRNAGGDFREADAHLRDLSLGLLSPPEMQLSLQQVRRHWNTFNSNQSLNQTLSGQTRNHYSDWVQSTIRDTTRELRGTGIGGVQPQSLIDRRRPGYLNTLFTQGLSPQRPGSLDRQRPGVLSNIWNRGLAANR